MPCKNPRATHQIDPFGLNIVQNHVQLKLFESCNSYADENHAVHLVRLENGSDDQTNRLGIDNMFHNLWADTS